jgi:hypothetical protein
MRRASGPGSGVFNCGNFAEIVSVFVIGISSLRDGYCLAWQTGMSAPPGKETA